jgi:ATP synthase protein I
MSDSTSRTTGNEAPAPAAVAAARPTASSPYAGTRAFNRSIYGKALSRGYGDSMGRGLELVLTLVVMVGIGWLADRIFGTYPLFTIVLSVAGFAGITVKLFLGYDLEMRKHESDAVWNREAEAN